MKRLGSHSASCSSNCMYRSGSERPSIQKVIEDGTKIDKLYYGKYLPLRERKLLEKLIRTRAVYDDVRNQLVSSSRSSNQIDTDMCECNTRDVNDIERSSAVLKMVDLVDKGHIGSSTSKLSSCCSFCECSSLKKIKKHMDKHPQVHRHYVPPDVVEKYVAEAEKRSLKRQKQLKTKVISKTRTVRFKIKNSRSEPCACPLSLSSVSKSASKAYMKKVRPREVSQAEKVEINKGDALKKKIVSCSCKIAKKIKNIRGTSKERTAEGENKKYANLQDSIALYKKKQQKKRFYEDWECELGTCVKDECIPEECLKKIKTRGVKEKKRRKHHSKHSETGMSQYSISTRPKKVRQTDSRIQAGPTLDSVICECKPITSKTSTGSTGNESALPVFKPKRSKKKYHSHKQIDQRKQLEVNKTKKGRRETKLVEVSPGMELGHVICECKPSTKSISSMTTIQKTEVSKTKRSKTERKHREIENVEVTPKSTLKRVICACKPSAKSISSLKTKVSKIKTPKTERQHTDKTDYDEADYGKKIAAVSPKSTIKRIICACKPSTKSITSMTSTQKTKGSETKKSKIKRRHETGHHEEDHEKQVMEVSPKSTFKRIICACKPAKSITSLKTKVSKIRTQKTEQKHSDKTENDETDYGKKLAAVSPKPNLGAVICECKPSTKSTASRTSFQKQKVSKTKRSESERKHRDLENVQVSPKSNLGAVICECKPSTKSTASRTSIQKQKVSKTKRSEPERKHRDLENVQVSPKSTIKRDICPCRPSAKSIASLKRKVSKIKTQKTERKPTDKTEYDVAGYGKDIVAVPPKSNLGAVICECKPSTKTSASMTSIKKQKVSKTKRSESERKHREIENVLVSPQPTIKRVICECKPSVKSISSIASTLKTKVSKKKRPKSVREKGDLEPISAKPTLENVACGCKPSIKSTSSKTTRQKIKAKELLQTPPQTKDQSKTKKTTNKKTTPQHMEITSEVVIREVDGQIKVTEEIRQQKVHKTRPQHKKQPHTGQHKEKEIKQVRRGQLKYTHEPKSVTKEKLDKKTSSKKIKTKSHKVEQVRPLSCECESISPESSTDISKTKSTPISKKKSRTVSKPKTVKTYHHKCLCRLDETGCHKSTCPYRSYKKKEAEIHKDTDSEKQAVKISSSFKFEIEFSKTKQPALTSTETLEHSKAKRVKRLKSTHSTRKQSKKYLHNKTQVTGALPKTIQDSSCDCRIPLPYPRECEPSMCIPYECNSKNCARILLPRPNSRGRSTLSSTDRLRRKSTGSATFQQKTRSKCKCIQSKSVDNVVRKSKAPYSRKTKEPRSQIVERNIGAESSSPQKRVVRVSSSFSFETEFYVQKSPSVKTDGKKDFTTTKTLNKVKNHKEYRRKHKHQSLRNVSSQSRSTLSHKSNQVGHTLKRCLCTLKLLQKKRKQKVKDIVSKKTMASFRNKEHENVVRIRQTQTKTSGITYVTPPATSTRASLANDCKCSGRIKLHKRKDAKSVTKEINTDLHQSLSRKMQHSETKNKNECPCPKHGKIESLDYVKSERQKVRLGSSFNFSIEFSKQISDLQSIEPPREEIKYKSMKKEIKQTHQLGMKPRIHCACGISETNKSVKIKQTDTEPFLQKCLCTLKLLKKNKAKFETSPPWQHKNEYIMHMQNKPITTKTVAICNNVQQPSFLSYDCDCDFGTISDESKSLTRESEKKEMNNRFNKDTVQVGSSFSFNIEFSKKTCSLNKSKDVVLDKCWNITNEDVKNKCKLEERRRADNLNTKRSSYIGSAIRRCFCTLKILKKEKNVGQQITACKSVKASCNIPHAQVCECKSTSTKTSKCRPLCNLSHEIAYQNAQILECKSTSTKITKSRALYKLSHETSCQIPNAQICKCKSTNTKICKPRHNLSYENIPNLIIPEMCDPYKCDRNKRRELQPNHGPKKKSAMCLHNRVKHATNKSLILRTIPNQMQSRRSYLPSQKSVYIGSNFSFNIQFSKNPFGSSIQDTRNTLDVPQCKSCRIKDKGKTEAIEIGEKDKVSNLGFSLKRCFCTLGLKKEKSSKRCFCGNIPITSQCVQIYHNETRLNRHNTTKSRCSIYNKALYDGKPIELKLPEGSYFFKENPFRFPNGIKNYDTQDLPNISSFTKPAHSKSRIDVNIDDYQTRYLQNAQKMGSFFQSYYAYNVHVSKSKKGSHNNGVLKDNECEVGVCKSDKCDPVDCLMNKKKHSKHKIILGSDFKVKLGVYKDTNPYKKDIKIEPKIKKLESIRKVMSRSTFLGKCFCPLLKKTEAQLEKQKKIKPQNVQLPRAALRIGSDVQFDLDFFRQPKPRYQDSNTRQKIPDTTSRGKSFLSMRRYRNCTPKPKDEDVDESDVGDKKSKGKKGTKPDKNNKSASPGLCQCIPEKNKKADKSKKSTKPDKKNKSALPEPCMCTTSPEINKKADKSKKSAKLDKKNKTASPDLYKCTTSPEINKKADKAKKSAKPDKKTKSASFGPCKCTTSPGINNKADKADKKKRKTIEQISIDTVTIRQHKQNEKSYRSLNKQNVTIDSDINSETDYKKQLRQLSWCPGINKCKFNKLHGVGDADGSGQNDTTKAKSMTKHSVKKTKEKKKRYSADTIEEKSMTKHSVKKIKEKKKGYNTGENIEFDRTEHNFQLEEAVSTKTFLEKCYRCLKNNKGGKELTPKQSQESIIATNFHGRKRNSKTAKPTIKLEKNGHGIKQRDIDTIMPYSKHKFKELNENQENRNKKGNKKQQKLAEQTETSPPSTPKPKQDKNKKGNKKQQKLAEPTETSSPPTPKPKQEKKGNKKQQKMAEQIETSPSSTPKQDKNKKGNKKQQKLAEQTETSPTSTPKPKQDKNKKGNKNEQKLAEHTETSPPSTPTQDKNKKGNKKQQKSAEQTETSPPSTPKPKQDKKGNKKQQKLAKQMGKSSPPTPKPKQDKKGNKKQQSLAEQMETSPPPPSEPNLDKNMVCPICNKNKLIDITPDIPPPEPHKVVCPCCEEVFKIETLEDKQCRDCAYRSLFKKKRESLSPSNMRPLFEVLVDKDNMSVMNQDEIITTLGESGDETPVMKRAREAKEQGLIGEPTMEMVIDRKTAKIVNDTEVRNEINYPTKGKKGKKGKVKKGKSFPVADKAVPAEITNRKSERDENNSKQENRNKKKENNKKGNKKQQNLAEQIETSPPPPRKSNLDENMLCPVCHNSNLVDITPDGAPPECNKAICPCCNEVISIKTLEKKQSKMDKVLHVCGCLLNMKRGKKEKPPPPMKPLFEVLVNKKNMRVMNKDEIMETLGATGKDTPVMKKLRKANEQGRIGEPTMDMLIDRKTATIVNHAEVRREINYPKKGKVKKGKSFAVAEKDAPAEIAVKVKKGKSFAVTEKDAPIEIADKVKKGKSFAVAEKDAPAEIAHSKSDRKAPSKPHGNNCKCCLCRTIKKNTREVGGGINYMPRKLRPCTCGSVVCKSDWDKLKKEERSIKTLKIKTCVCGSTVCKEESQKMPEILLEASRQVQEDKFEKKEAMKREKIYQKERRKRQKQYEKEDKKRVARRRKTDKRKMKYLKKYGTAPDILMAAESLVDLGTLGAKGLADAARSLGRVAKYPKDGVANIKDAIDKPSILSKKCKQRARAMGTSATMARIGARLSKMKVTQALKTKLESYPVTNYIVHIADKDPTKRMKKFRKKKVREPLDFQCSLFMGSLRKRPCWQLYYMCPWFYPHFINILGLWRQFADVMLFILAAVVWSPCILTMELCRAIMCCFFCTG